MGGPHAAPRATRAGRTSCETSWRKRRLASAALGAALSATLATSLPPEGVALAPERPGVALREALAAEARGDLAAAEAGLAAVSRAHPIISDHADWLRVRVLLAAGRPRDAAAVAEAALAAQRDTPLAARFHEKLGEAERMLGDEAAAREAWSQALAESRDPRQRAALLALLAASLERSGLGGEARGRWLELWRDQPSSPEAAEAGAALERSETRPGALRRSASDHLARGEALYGALANDAALASFDRALALGLNERETARALERRAHTLFRLRRYAEAAAAFDRVDDPAAAIEHARAIARAGDAPAAVRELEALVRTLEGGQGERARYVAAILLEDEQPERARAHFEVLAGAARDPATRRDARWRLAWGAYREERFEDALAGLARLEALDSEGLGRAQARYWRARTLERLGDPSAGQGFGALAGELPLSYYGWRAQARLGDAAPAASASRPGPASGERRVRPRALERVRILVEAGLHDEARAELEILARGGLALGDRLDLAELASDAGDLHRAQRLVADPYAEELARGPRTGLEELWWLAWPWAYPEAPRDGSVPPELVRAVMREESGYRPEVVSVAGARGLLQIMPDTGERLARDMGLAFAPDDLFDPAVNLRLGTHYLGELSAQFTGRVSAAVGSYNAGPQAVERWIAERGGLDDDEWVESIPYEQTRTYVKRVLRSMHAYELLY